MEGGTRVDTTRVDTTESRHFRVDIGESTLQSRHKVDIESKSTRGKLPVKRKMQLLRTGVCTGIGTTTSESEYSRLDNWSNKNRSSIIIEPWQRNAQNSHAKNKDGDARHRKRKRRGHNNRTWWKAIGSRKRKKCSYWELERVQVLALRLAKASTVG